MTILQGTMQDGSVIPIQVDAQGRLVAEGLPGPAGPPGPEGPAGGSVTDPSTLPRLPYPPLATDLLVAWRTGTRYAIPMGDLFPDLLGANESTPIATVSAIAPVDYASSILVYNRYPSGWHQRALLFDGSTDTFMKLDDDSTLWGGFQFATPVTGAFELYARAVSHGSAVSTPSLRINEAATYPAPSLTGSWVSISETTIRSIEAKGHDGGSTYLAAIRQSGAIMTGAAGYTDLTFADGAGLNAFAPGDQVVAVNGATGLLESGTGGVVAVSAAARTMRLSGVSGSWQPGFVVRKYV